MMNMNMNQIPVLKPSPTQAEIEAVTQVISSSWWGEGPVVLEFERLIATMHNRRYAVAVNSCTAALHLSVISHDIGPGDEVIVPALTFISTALAVAYVGAIPIFADVHPDTLCLDSESVLPKLTKRTKAIIPVDYAGYPAWPDVSIIGISTIQDAAHHCGGVAYGDSVCISFHPVKNVATGDGGAILLDDPERAKRLRALRWCGIDRSTWQRMGKRYSWDYAIEEIGYKCHWNDIQAAIGLSQLRRMPEISSRRQAIAERYGADLRLLSEREFLTLPSRHKRHTNHLYPIRVPATMRDALLDFLAERNISAGVHYKPLTYYPMFAQETPPVTESEWRRLVSLPIYTDMTEEDQTRVIEAVYDFFAR